jgi:membrane associated rhomboid family serine protease
MAEPPDAAPPSPRRARRGREPIVNAPTLPLLAAGLLVALHAASLLIPADARDGLIFDYAVFPARASASPEDGGYRTIFAAAAPIFGHALLHANWLHVMVNAGMLLAFGSGVARWLGLDRRGARSWLIVALAATAGGAGLYLALNLPDGGPAVGASGMVSGLWAAAFLMGPRGGLLGLLSPRFLVVTIAFLLANAALALMGPSLVGGAVAWEAHVGGYAAGALAMKLVARRRGELT